MHRYRNILTAIDCSDADMTVIEHVSSLASEPGSVVHLLHVVHSHTLDQDRDLRMQAVTLLNGYREKMQADGIDARVIIRSGEPEDEILSEIEENGYDLLAMATHGHRLPERILFGSVSRTLRKKITIPLLLINSDR
ncbi:universal stress protein [Chlorobium ferrooxidans]|uniref:UspA n=1 Tax=Chlorobium ferrooxidans DSM 13031 TaxID=377431 RepID=Q0YRN4_9CHLB|nr:universal stress protein [Chlorobium ferrooxidans]EAT58978.1 UspA [Chlorobium ferrooxidans DSM 13031]